MHVRGYVWHGMAWHIYYYIICLSVLLTFQCMYDRMEVLFCIALLDKATVIWSRCCWKAEQTLTFKTMWAHTAFL